MAERDDILPFRPDGEHDAVIAARIEALYVATPARSAADAARCSAAVLAAAKRGATGVIERGWRDAMPRQRWWWGAAAAAVLVAVTMRPWRPGVSTRDADSAVSAAIQGTRAAAPQGSITPVDGGEAVRFDLKLPPTTRDVALVGDFNGWDERANPMLRRNGDGTWSARVELPPGRHVYAFVVDGQRWLVDPLAPQVPDAGFGPANAVVIDGTQ